MADMAANLRHLWAGVRTPRNDPASGGAHPTPGPLPAGSSAVSEPEAPGEPLQPLDRVIFDALTEPARPAAAVPTIPVLRPDHGRWWEAGAARVGDDIVLHVKRPLRDPGMTSQCLVTQGDQTWSHQAGTANASAGGPGDLTHSVRFPRDFEGPPTPPAGGTFHVTWTAVYNANSWVLLNSASFRTVYRGTLRY